MMLSEFAAAVLADQQVALILEMAKKLRDEVLQLRADRQPDRQAIRRKEQELKRCGNDLFTWTERQSHWSDATKDEVRGLVLAWLDALIDRDGYPFEPMRDELREFSLRKGTAGGSPPPRREKELQVLEAILSQDPFASLSLPILAPYAFTLAFPFKLAKAYLSGGDEELYLHENPVAKDKVFKVPLVTPATWKGNLRWTAMKRLVDRCGAQSGQPDIENYAHERFCLSRLFGDEKGDEPGKPTDVADYLDRMCPARTSDEDETRNGESFREKCDATGPCPYRMKMREHFEVEGSVASQPGERPPVPHHAGRVHLYPTFFDNIGLEVINPHKRATRAGTKPIYLETVPKGSIGWFRLLYYPHDLIGRDDGYARRQVAEDLELLAAAVKEMLLTYGFGAKKTSGFGLATDTLPKKRDRETLPKGALIVNAPGEVQSAEFGRVSEMVDTAKGIAQQLKQEAT